MNGRDFVRKRTEVQSSRLSCTTEGEESQEWGIQSSLPLKRDLESW